MGHDNRMISDCTERLQEQRLRDQLNEACRLARELDERVRSIPAGNLGAPGGGDQAAAASLNCTSTQLRSSIAIASADVIAAFNEAVKLLLQTSRIADHHFSAASSPPKSRSADIEAINLAGESSLVQMKSPPLSPCSRPAAAGSSHHGQQVNMRSATATPSPPRTIYSPLLSAATSAMSDGSPKDHPADEATTVKNPSKAVIDRKRKLLPKVNLKMPAGSPEAADSNTPPDDGHTWRKYGQKDILGAHYPRSYYRCTHKTDVGCPAVKQVQRCDEDGSFFDVIYKGYHTCRSAEIDRECWPLAFQAFPQGLISSFSSFPGNVISSSSPSATCNIPPTASVPSLMLPNNMSTAIQISAARGNHASFDSSMLAHQLRHVVSTPSASSAALPMFNGANADLSVCRAQLMASSANLPAVDCNSHALMNAPFYQYKFNSAELPESSAAAAGGAHHLYPTQDRRSQLPQKGPATSSSYGGSDYEGHAAGSIIYASEQGRALNPLEDWPDHNYDRESYKKLVPKASDNNIEPTTNCSSAQAILYGSLQPSACNMQLQETMVPSSQQQQATILSPPSTPHTTSSQHPQLAANALAFDTCMDNDELLHYVLD